MHQAIAIWNDILGGLLAEGNTADALGMLQKLLLQYKAIEEEVKTKAGATPEEKTHAEQQVKGLLLQAMELNVPGNSAFHEEYIQRLKNNLGASSEPQESDRVLLLTTKF